ncbi:MAG: FG-GAP-like repeat-containing protein, partial [Verrucomicrobiota bacterium]
MQHPPFYVISPEPYVEEIDVGVGEALRVNFNLAPDLGTFDLDAFRVHSRQSGPLSGTFALTPGLNQIEFTPSADFSYGDRIEVTLTDVIQAQAGDPLLPFQWAFTVESPGCSNLFFNRVEQLANTDWTSRVEPADLDNDGDLDLLLIMDSGVTVVFNQGAGGFAHSGVVFQPPGHRDFDLNDLDDDGDLDLFVASSFACSIWLNDGAGNFSDTGQRPLTNSTFDVTLADFDADGDPDAFIAAEDGNVVLLNDGAANFTDSNQRLGSSHSVACVHGDFDFDGDLDVYAGNGMGQPDRLWFNDGDGAFYDSGQALGADSAIRVLGADIDLDNDLDVVTIGSSGYGLWTNNGQGLLSGGPLSLPVHGDGGDLGDLDGDGDLDLIVSDALVSVNTIWLNDGTGQFAAGGLTLSQHAGRDVALGDFDGDGDLDAYVATLLEDDEIWLNESCAHTSGIFQVTTVDPGPGDIDVASTQSVRIAFDQDLDLNSVISNTFGVSSRRFGPVAGTVSLASTNELLFVPAEDFRYGDVIDVRLTAGIQSLAGHNLQPYTFSFTVEALGCASLYYQLGAPLFGNSGSTFRIETGDLNGDGHLDIIDMDFQTALNIWLNDGAGGMTLVTPPPAPAWLSDFKLGDLDGDGDLDICLTGGDCRIWFNDGTGHFTDIGQALSSGQTLSLADFNGDNALDLYLGRWSMPGKIYFNDGSGTFIDSGAQLAAYDELRSNTGDFDNDGDIDIFVATSREANEVWLNNGNGQFAPRIQPYSYLNTTMVLVGDVDLDGDLDAVLIDPGRGAVTYLNDGTGL